MKRILLAVLFFSGSAFAAVNKQNNVFGDLSFSSGGVHFGGGYEYIYNGSEGIGGHLQMFQKKSKDSKTVAPGYLVIGAMTGFHFYKGDWDFALTPSMNIINVDVEEKDPGDKTTLGPGISISLTTALNDKVAIGFDYQNYYIWFGDDYRGPAITDLSFRLKVGF
jgi:hypothetical protein